MAGHLKSHRCEVGCAVDGFCFMSDELGSHNAENLVDT